MSAVPLHQLEVQTTCNTTDDEIIANLKASKERNWTKWLDVNPEVNPRPLIVCGSGPSAWQILKEIGVDKCDIMALNGAYNALKSAGYKPKYYCQLDAREFNVPFVSNPDHDTEFFLAAQCHPAVYDALQGYKVTSFHLATETSQKVFGGESGTFLGGSGGTVGMTALALAGVIGYRTLILVGFDSSYDEGKSHMVDQPQNKDQPVIPVEFCGRWYLTTATLAEQTMKFFDDETVGEVGSDRDGEIGHSSITLGS